MEHARLVDRMVQRLAAPTSLRNDEVEEWRKALLEVRGWAQEAAEETLDQAAEAALEHLSGWVSGSADVELLASHLEVLRELMSACGLGAPDAAPSPAPAPAPAPPPPPAPAPAIDVDFEILGEFVVQAREQLAEAGEHLLRLEKQAGDTASLNAVFRSLHTIKGVAGFLQLGTIEQLAHASEDLLDQARSGLRRLTGEALEVVFTAARVLEQLVGEVGAAVSAGRPPASTGSTGSDALIARIRALVASAEPAAPVEATAPAPETAPPAPLETSDEAAGDGRSDSLRIDAARLDRLIEMLGEMVITESMAARLANQEARAGSELLRTMARLTKITREIQQHAGSLRMVPVRATFQRMARLARDVARRSGKQLEFVTSGGHTELDKSVVERVGDPLLHLMRNAIDHGLEPAAERQRAGKPPAGRVELRAFHRGGNIVIEVEDDGRGLDERKIAAKARERGLLREGETPTTRDILRLICAPGFSTAENVNSISGRGVGMDVVKRQLDAMGGSLEITSTPGKGTCFSMRLPLTLAVIDGMVVRLGRDRYILPTLSLVRLITSDDGTASGVPGGDEILALKHTFVPVLPLDRIYDSPRDGSAHGLAVIAESDGQQVAIFIDELVGQVQAVIKSVTGSLGEVAGISGCAILPDGRVGLVLDVGGLIRLAATHHRDGAPPLLAETGVQ